MEVFLINAEIKREIELKEDRVPLLRIYAFFVLYFIILYYVLYYIIEEHIYFLGIFKVGYDKQFTIFFIFI